MSEIIYGRNAVKEALENGRVEKIIALANHEFLKLAEERKIPFEVVNRARLDKLTRSGNHQGVLAYAKEFHLSTVEEMLKKENGLIVVLDGIQDVHNLGAIIRTCECAGADGLIYKKHGSAHLNDTVSKVACGALEYLKVAEVANVVNTLKKLKEAGYWIVGSSGYAKQSYDDLNYDFNTVLVIGSESDGMSRLVTEECDYTVKLPLQGKTESLNASVSAGILIYEVLEKRGIKAK
ncbi:MAG: 23S rRNA (guanosine(2251)-2'-O)-methyltransferase RlmB [Erysipelotrichaceae bacterium]|nr:23S rRNA (guanosine(2251)-2'-O)-methyltransferase RlmB [Erysipelotrichaceae bacterium]